MGFWKWHNGLNALAFDIEVHFWLTEWNLRVFFTVAGTSGEKRRRNGIHGQAKAVARLARISPRCSTRLACGANAFLAGTVLNKLVV